MTFLISITHPRPFLVEVIFCYWPSINDLAILMAFDQISNSPLALRRHFHLSNALPQDVLGEPTESRAHHDTMITDN